MRADVPFILFGDCIGGSWTLNQVHFLVLDKDFDWQSCYEGSAIFYFVSVTVDLKFST